jgi:hypothetical protein
MKHLAILLLSLTLYVSFVSASTSLKQLIQKVKKSSGDERRVAMNALKVKLRSMNLETRRHVMNDLKKSFSGNQQHNRHGVAKARVGQGNMNLGSTGNIPARNAMGANTLPSPSHSVPTTVPKLPHKPTIPSRPQHAPQIPQAPQVQPPHPQVPSPPKHIPNMPSPNFGQPRGHR